MRLYLAGLVTAAWILLGASAAAQSPLQEWYSQAVGSEFGHSVALCPDLDGDGKAELFVGAPRLGEGRAALYSSATGLPSLILSGSLTGQRFGEAVAVLDDLDGDGAPDLIVGGPSSAVNLRSYVRVFSSGSGGLIHEFEYPNGNSGFGEDLDSIQDLDGDGIGDFVIMGEGQGWPLGPYPTGFVEVRSGGDGHLLHAIFGVAGSFYYPASISTSGDVSGDGVEDILVGFAGGLVHAGRVEVFSGAGFHSLYSLTGVNLQDEFGASVAILDDLDGDGCRDWIGGAFQGEYGLYAPTGPGYARVHSGKTGALLFEISGDTLGDFFGATVADVGDVNADGTGDFAVGAPQRDFGDGYLRVYSGVDASILYEIRGLNFNDEMGYACAGGEDLDGDGIDDFAVGAQRFEGPVPNSGAVFGYAGAPLILSGTPGLAGTTNHLRVIDATPGATVHFVWGSAPGTTPVPGCAGLEVGIDQAQVLGAALADPSGLAFVSVAVPASAAGATVYAQAVELASCTRSNLLVHTLR